MPRPVMMILGLCLSAFLIGRPNGENDQQSKKGSEVSFAEDLFPVIKKYCAACHSHEADHPSGLFMETYEDVMGEGRHGKAVIPGNAGKSNLYQKLLPAPPFGRVMPPSRRIKLTPEQIELFRRWIDQGAKNN
ncbi:MAG: c-type cytochrome domain-containing protein [Bacteroidota bacterium]